MNQNDLTVGRIYHENRKKLGFLRINGDIGHDTVVTSSKLNRPGLEISGFWESFDPHRIQLIGEGEFRYIKTLSGEKVEEIFEHFFSAKIPLMIFAHDVKPPVCAVRLARKYQVALLATPVTTTLLVASLLDYLDRELAPSTIIHGSLVDVYGIGLLLTGPSGIGKSEIALDLVGRGHRLVADDVVKIIRRADNIIIGSGVEILEHHLELRGLGIVDVRNIYGIRAIRQQKRIEVQIELEEWDNTKNFERIGAQEKYNKILDVDIPIINLPIYPGKNITVIAEVIALNHVLKIMGTNAALNFQKKIAATIRQKTQISDLQNYLKKDLE
ncbi:MAG: HPr(Ser) kinase/phosphatase [Candidatus Marinimicrobia bacterium]|jgi:HPr kinase/phosphorylase|nr:HPr(Ser) kinase/phosphatase [Candidatus Neomarinimicrobiota bacterium]MBP9005519.1 HPr(Ser) kinase/phosphatase [Candidatus Neomarinimicrobiota bacterium]NLA22191.1 HPr(Ser) kinase/phosphatase [Candidatus Neomarinimicrobiota bacterium]HNZ37026.1 HPr(Ser) kinase/phosphatase [Candidatus Neomarinimicrobiota bacterium]HOD37442.1 HPr(Ser) kinase/phosphatase [Candidatus Neomarinimicrobiota bacterium]